MVNQISKNILVSSGKFDKEKRYWLNKLSGDLPVSSFFPGPVKDGVGKGERKSQRFTLPREVNDGLFRIANSSEYGIFLVLLSSLNCLLFQYTDNTDIVVGTPVFKQDIEGDYINNTLALKNRIDGAMTFKELLLQVKKTVEGATENMNYPFDLLKEELDGGGRDNGFHLYDTFIGLRNIQDNNAIREQDCRTVFSFNIRGEKVLCEIDFDPVYFDEKEAGTLHDRFVKGLACVVRDPGIEISRIDILSEGERQNILFDLNRTRFDYRENAHIHELFDEQAGKTPDAAAAVFENEILTYRELQRRADGLAGILNRSGLEPGEVTGVMVERSLYMVIGVLSVLKAGGACLLIDSEMPTDRIMYMLEDCRVSILLTGSGVFDVHPFSKLKLLRRLQPDVYVTGKRDPISDLDILPMPDRTAIDHWRYDPYIGDPMVKNTYITMQTTRGCPFNCAYCHRIWPKSHFYRSAEKIFEELMLYYRMGVRRFSMVDDIFNLNVKNSRKFFELILKNRLDVQLFFPSGMRGDILKKEYIDLMVEAGVVLFGLALETASPRLQKLIGKNLNLEKFRENARYICEKYPQVILEFQTMHGFPTETKEEAMITMDFVKSMKWLHFPYVNIVNVFVNTDMERIALENGFTKENILVSEGLAYHELPETLPFDKKFTITYQNDFLNNYFLSKERLLYVLPYQANILTKDELVQKYDSYLPADIRSFTGLLQFVGIEERELGIETFLDEEHMLVPDLDEKIRKYFPVKKPGKDALRILLLDFSQLFTGDKRGMLYDLVEPPLGLMSLLAYLGRRFAGKINGKIAKPRIDFDNYDELKKLLDDFRPDIIGIRTLTFYMDFFHETAALIRQWGFAGTIVAGGPHATTNYATVLNDRNVDLVVLGEGELTFTELIEKILSNGNKLPDDDVLKEIKGIAFIPRELRSKKSPVREMVVIDELTEALMEETGKTHVVANPSADLAFMVFTSGSTGVPKGVMLRHGGIINHVYAKIKELNLDGRDVMCQNLNVGFVASIWQFFAPLFLGAPLHVYPGEVLPDPYEFFKKIDKDKVTVCEVIPSFLSAYLELLEAGKPKVMLENLETLALTGERVPPSLVDRFYKRYDIVLINAYGQGECSDDTLHYRIPFDKETQRVPIGKPANNTRVYILTADGLPKPAGLPGELHIAGQGLAAGYLNNPGLTAEKFIPDPFVPGGRIFRTGDIARLAADGNVEFLGRIDQQVKIRGYRVELEEIESILLKHPVIEEAVAAAAGDDEHGSLCAYVVLKGRLDFAEIKGRLSRHLPEYMIPAYYIEVDHIPRTHSGKIDRAKLPAPGTGTGDGASAAISGELEKSLVNVWSAVLRVDSGMINAGGNFFELGGNSLKAVSLVAGINKKLNVDIPMTALFDNPTIEKLAAYIEETGEVRYSLIEAAEKKEYYAVSSAQKRMYTVTRLEPMSRSFNYPVVFPFKFELDRDKIRATFLKIIGRHQIFRTFFEIIDSELVQIIHDDIRFEMDVYQIDDDAGTEESEGIVSGFRRPFDLSQSPLFRVGMITGKKNESTLMIDIHHIICDATSMEIMMRDFLNLYEDVEMPVLRLQYKDYAEWQNSDTQREVLKKQGEYWLELYRGKLPVLDLPVDTNRVSGPASRGGIVNVGIQEKETRALRKIALENGTTLFIILLAAYNVLLAKLCDQEDIVVGVPAAGRTHDDLKQVAGVFVNLLALRNGVDGKLTFKEFLAMVNENTLKAYENQAFQFDELAAKLGQGNASLVRTEFLIHEQDIQAAAADGETEADELTRSVNKVRFSERVDLALIGSAAGDHITAEFHYKTAIFTRKSVGKIAGYLQNIVTTVVMNENIRLNDIDLLSPVDKERITASMEKDRKAFEELKREDFDEIF